MSTIAKKNKNYDLKKRFIIILIFKIKTHFEVFFIKYQSMIIKLQINIYELKILLLLL
jgi:hypothetical protein